MTAFSRIAASARARLGMLARQYTLNASERAFVARAGVHQVPADAPVVLVQCVEDHFYVSLFDWVVTSLRERGSLRVDGIVARGLRACVTSSVTSLLKGLVYQNALTDLKWNRLYRVYTDRRAYRSAGISLSWQEVRDLRTAWRVWRSVSSKEELLELKLEGILVGDLVYDTYLRFKPAPTLELRDPYLVLVLWQTLRDIRRANRYFSRLRPKCFLTSYSSYINHGVPVRIALQKGIRVFSFGNFQEFAKELSTTDFFHTRNPNRYREIFRSLPDQERRRAAADESLGRRIGGAIDHATSYMRRSAYSGSGRLNHDVRGAAVVFLHDFFDSPHCFQWMLFADFWEWAKNTFQIARDAGVRLFAKPHPNEVVESQHVVAKLKEMFPEVTFLPPDVSNTELVNAGIACGITVRGSVANELAYLGVPTIGAGHHPHISFDFCQTARTLEEYEALIRRCGELRYSPEELRRQSVECYYMHNLHYTPEELQLRDVEMRHRARCLAVGDNFPDASECCETSRAVRENPAFRQFIDQLAQIIWSKS